MKFTPKQREVLKVLSRRNASAEKIADEIDIKPKTVKSRISYLRNELGIDIPYDGGEYQLNDDIELERELNKHEAHILRSLPKSPKALADQFQVFEGVIHAHIESIKEKGYDVQWDKEAEVYHIDAAVKRRIGSTHMSVITRKANNWLTATEDQQIRQLQAIKPVIATQTPIEGNQDVVGVLSDLHVGQDVEDEHGNVVYSEPEWREAVRVFKQKCIDKPANREKPVDTFHLLLNGDFVTNENIYHHQLEEVGAYIADQIDIALDELIPLVISLAEHYDTVNVVCQVGNHGQMRATGQTKQANADLFVYRGLKRVLSYTQYDNVNFQVGDATAFKTFKMRGDKWNALATHGEDAYEQITGTSASDSLMDNWLVGVDPRPDIFYLAHYHQYRRAPVSGIPALRSPSPKPGGPFEWKIGKMTARNAIQKIGFIHGVSDNRPITWTDVIGYE